MPNICERFESAAADFFWVPPHTSVVERAEVIYTHSPEDSWLYNCVGFVRTRAETAGPLVVEVSAAHLGRQSRWAMFSHAPQPWLEDALREAKYSPVQEMDLRAASVDGFTPRPPSEGVTVRRVQTRPELIDSYRAINRAFDQPKPQPSDEHLDRELRLLAESNSRVARFVVYDRASGEAISSGGLTMDRRHAVGFLWAGGTAPEYRGRGAYSSLVSARVSLAREVGLTHVGLFAVVDTSSPIVAKQGFDRFGGVTYWERGE